MFWAHLALFPVGVALSREVLAAVYVAWREVVAGAKLLVSCFSTRAPNLSFCENRAHLSRDCMIKK